jgi:hypothetical protein
MKHIISFSGGAGSFATAKLVKDKCGLENIVMAFCDTLIEDEDLYRFNLDVAEYIFETSVSSELRWLCNNVPPVYEDHRNAHLFALCGLWNKELPSFHYLQLGLDIWEVFYKKRWVGNSRTAHCTTELKGKQFARWLNATYSHEECVIHFGFDWTESHRFDGAKKNWHPYTCESVLCDAPYYTRQQIMQMIDDAEIDLPRLYEMGFSHNNCGGFCVKAGQKHFKLLLEKLPKVFEYHEDKLNKILVDIPTTKPFLKKTENKEVRYLSLTDFKGGQDVDVGTPCGCFSDGSEIGIVNLIGFD